MEITASMVKELRETTGAGMMDCKKALSECDGSMEAAIDWLREKGFAKATKKGVKIVAFLYSLTDFSKVFTIKFLQTLLNYTIFIR